MAAVHLTFFLHSTVSESVREHNSHDLEVHNSLEGGLAARM